MAQQILSATKIKKKDQEVWNIVISIFSLPGITRNPCKDNVLPFKRTALKWKWVTEMIRKRSLLRAKRQKDGQLNKIYSITSILCRRPLALKPRKSHSSIREGLTKDLIKNSPNFSWKSFILRFLTTNNSPKEWWMNMPRKPKANSIL